MPDCLIVMKYSQRKGVDIRAQYPKGKLKITKDTLMHIFNMHAFEEPGIASLSIDRINISTYYAGSKTDYFIILVLNLLENPDDFEEVLTEISLKIVDNLEENKYIEMLPELFKKLSEFPKDKEIEEI
jgi:hypothetical protein